MKVMPHYILSPDTRVRSREGYAGIPYSDGEDIESKLLKSLMYCSDVSIGSPELRDFITDWPSEYHFSPLRANLLRPFSFEGKRVLELGCGCGALTRFLGEQGAYVTAVEGSPRRAEVAAARCRDLPNVEVYCDNLADFETGSRFDVVTLIGVLEYSRLFVSGDDPVQSCLEIVRDYLEEDGVLYLAIENQLGLKYFNGYGEDHTGIPYYGIYDRYSEKTVVTFGRKELSERLHAAGFVHTEFLFPFPDYKLPELILTERALDHPSLRVGDLLCRMLSRDYGGIQVHSFHEGLAWQALARNGLVSDLANSFLVVAGKKSRSASTNWYVRTYSTERMREFATENVILEDQGALRVSKRRLFSMSVDATRFEHRVGTEDYVIGQLYVVDLQRILANGGGVPEIVAWARPWLDFLRSHTDKHGLLPGEYIDCIPSNLVRDCDGRFHYIDVEWHSRTPIPLTWIAVRGLVIATSSCYRAHSLGDINYKQYASVVLQKAGVTPTDQDWLALGEWEDALRMHCYGRFAVKAGFIARLETTWLSGTAYPACADMLQQSEDEIRRIKSTFSWQITKPLRLAYNTVRRLLG